jgi:hypothetical protein
MNVLKTTQSTQSTKPYNVIEKGGIFQRVMALGGLGGLVEAVPDPWKAKLPPKVAPSPLPMPAPAPTCYRKA